MAFAHRRGYFGVLAGDDFVPPHVDGKIAKHKDDEDNAVTLEEARKLHKKNMMMLLPT